jgi:uncharacterized protein YggU (UPF0235/DUF167 family)
MEIRVKITPHVKKESVELLPDGRFHVSVSADRKAGLANMRMRTLIARHFGVEEKNVSLVSGHTSATKTVRVNGVSK